VDRALWRPLFVVGGLLWVMGGATHPSAPTDLSFNDNLAVMMEQDAWVPSHSLMAVGMTLILVGLVVVRRGGTFPVTSRLMTFALVAAALNVVEMVVHTMAFVDRQELAADEAAPIAFTHLGLALIAYPLLGVAVVLLALRLARESTLLRTVAVIGVVGGAANALSVPLAAATGGNTFDFLFPVGAIGIAAWLVGVAAVGLAGRPTAAA
jgi:hypothetical protein